MGENEGIVAAVGFGAGADVFPVCHPVGAADVGCRAGADDGGVFCKELREALIFLSEEAVVKVIVG